MSYTILSVAYPMTPVGPDATGGSEQILTLLDRQLTAAGHRSLVLAVEGSRIKGELIASPRCTNGLNDETRKWGQRAHRRLLLDTLNKYPVDIVHMHSLDFHAYLPATSIPILATLHLPVDWYPQHVFQARRKHVFLNCVSDAQERCCPVSENLLPFVANGIDVGTFNWRNPKEAFVLALGRICPEKGFHLALDAAKEAGVPMILAGEVFPYQEHLSYFQREIVPRLDATRKYVGAADAKKKRELLAGASALLVPSLVAETSSLVSMEALASGTPVIAFPVGAIPELVEHGKTGYLVKGVREMASAIRRRTKLKSRDCREAAEERCDQRRMVRNYFALYRKMTKPSVARRAEPVQAGLSWLVDVS